MSYPTTVDSFATKNTNDTIQASHVNDLQTAVVAIENLLGTNASQTTPTAANSVPNSSSATAATWTPTPRLNRLGLGQAADSSAVMAATGQYFSTQITTTVTLDWNSGNVQYIQLASGAQTFTFANPKAGGRYILILKQPGAGAAGTVTWPVAVLWPGGSAPTLTVTNSKVDILSFVYDGTNTKYYATSSLNY